MFEDLIFKGLTLSIGFGGVFAFIGWWRDFRLKLKLEQFKILQTYRDRFRNDPIISVVHAYITDGGERPANSKIFFYMGQFEEIQIMVEKGLLDKDVAHTFFGAYAYNAVSKFKLSASDDWHVLFRFIEGYEKSGRTKAM
ncbi:MAG: hypothetical protein LDLANPLL_01641 [Turneriella sp.]|nr:hypothetical protein [Turneriella sp.]